jgi:hypothetical protein
MTTFFGTSAGGIARELHPFGMRHLQGLRQALESALSAWAGDWLAHDDEPPALPVQVSALPHTWGFEAWPCDSRSWGDARIWLDSSLAQQARLGHAILGPGGGTDVADRWLATLLERARRERDRALCVALAGSASVRPVRAPGDALPYGVCRPGSGAIRISCAGVGLDAVANFEAWRHHAQRPLHGTAATPARQPLVAVAAADLVHLV